MSYFGWMVIYFSGMGAVSIGALVAAIWVSRQPGVGLRDHLSQFFGGGQSD